MSAPSRQRHRRAMKPALRQARLRFAADLVLVKDRAGRLGLWRTMHALDAATKEVGWEIADILEGRQADTAEEPRS